MTQRKRLGVEGTRKKIETFVMKCNSKNKIYKLMLYVILSNITKLIK